MAAGRRRRAATYTVVGVLLVLLAGVGWLVLRGIQARSHLLDVYDSASALRTRLVNGDTADAASSLAAIQREARQAQSLTDDPVWRLTAHLPFVGSSVRVVRGVVAADRALADDVLPRLVAVADGISPTRLRVGGDTIRLAPLHAAQSRLESTATAIDAIRNRVQALPTHGLLGSISRARTRLVTQLTTLSGTTRTAATFARVAPSMLGEQGERRYFVAVQNNAEARGTGGLVGAFMVLSARNGRLSVAQVGNDTQLRDARTPAVELGRAFDALYAPYESTRLWRNSNLTPDFPTAARIWTALWQKTTGEQLDGALAIDPTLMADVLAVTGDATLPDNTRVTAANAVALTESDVYRRFADNQDARRQFLRTVAKAVVDKVLSGAGDPATLAHTLGADAGARHLALWSAHSAEESAIAGTALGAPLPPAGRPVAELFVNNVAGSKLDYWLRRSLVRQPGSCRADGTRVVTVTVRLTNVAPPGLPGYVVARFDHPAPGLPVGTNRLFVTLLTTHGSQLLSVRLDDRPTTVTFGEQDGLASSSTTLELEPQRTHTLELVFAEPGGGPPVVPVQPLAVPEAVLAGTAPPCPR